MGMVRNAWRVGSDNSHEPELKEGLMGINKSTFLFDRNVRQEINESGLPPCVIRLELINILREVEELEKVAIDKEQETEDAARDPRE